MIGFFSEASCWLPAQFTDSHTRYTNAFCRDGLIQLVQGEKIDFFYKPNTTQLPTYTDIFMRSDTSLEYILNLQEYFVNMKLSFADKLAIILAQLALALIVSAYFAQLNQSMQYLSISYSGNAELGSNKAMIGRYLGMYVLTTLTYTILGITFWVIVTRDNSVFPQHDGGIWRNTLLCDFQVIQQARIHQYVVQCQFSLSTEGPSSGISGFVGQIINKGNTCICFVAAIIGLIHVANLVLKIVSAGEGPLVARFNDYNLITAYTGECKTQGRSPNPATSVDSGEEEVQGQLDQLNTTEVPSEVKTTEEPNDVKTTEL